MNCLAELISKKYSCCIDKEISFSTLLLFCLNKIFALGRGFLKTRKMVFIERHVVLKSKRQISFGKNFRISENAKLDALSQNGIVFGNNCSVGINTRIECTGSLSFLGKGFKCGNNCGLGTDCFYGAAGGIEIGNDVIVGNFVSMHSENHNYSNPKIPIRLQGVNHKGIKIGSNCWIGAKSIILDGTIIGTGCVVAAGAVVTGVFPDNVIIGGVPAKVIKGRVSQ